MTAKLIAVMRRQARSVVYLQALVALVVSSLFGLTLGWHAAGSALLAGSICVVTNLYYVYRVFKTTGAQHAHQVVGGFYRGEMAKLGLSVLLFVAAFTLLELKPLPFFVSYIMTQGAFSLALFVFKPRTRVES